MCYQKIQFRHTAKDESRYSKALLENKTCRDCRFRFEYPLSDKMACQFEGKIEWQECCEMEMGDIVVPAQKGLVFNRNRYMKDFDICCWFEAE